MTHFDLAEELRRERWEAGSAATLFAQACQAGDVDAFYEAVDRLNRLPGGWLSAICKVAREVRAVDPAIQLAFLRVWTESRMLPLRVGNHRALSDTARILLPRYRGPAVRLYRGAGAAERQRRIYGFSWTTDSAAAERFAQQRRMLDVGSVLLETLAPPEAIICQIDYPPPFTQDEIDEIKRKHPDVVIDEFHEEREYVVDRRLLKAVNVVSRYEQVHPVAP